VSESVSDNTPDPTGTKGEPRSRRTKGLYLRRRALAAGWDVPDQAKREAVELFRQVIQSDAADERSRISAAKGLVSASHAEIGALDVALRARAQLEIEQRLKILENHLEATNADESV
jgi:hypothetical protein